MQTHIELKQHVEKLIEFVVSVIGTVRVRETRRVMELIKSSSLSHPVCPKKSSSQFVHSANKYHPKTLYILFSIYFYFYFIQGKLQNY